MKSGPAMVRRFVIYTLAFLLCPLLAAASLRLLSFDGGVARLGVSTDKSRFTVRSSTDRTNWVERGTTWIFHGGTNEVLVSVPLPAATSTFLQLAP